MPALQVLDHIKQSGSHLVLVVDEYGGTDGLLTHHDILEAIAGGMPLGETPHEPKAVQRNDGSWLLDGMLSVDEFKEIFGLEDLPGEKKDAFQTLRGFIFTQMGRVPEVSEHFEWNGLRFEIVDRRMASASTRCSSPRSYAKKKTPTLKNFRLPVSPIALRAQILR